MDLAKRTDRIIIAILLLMAAGLALYFFLPRRAEEPEREPSPLSEKVTYEDYNGKKLGILTGTNLESMTFEYFPDSEYLYFDGYPNISTALENGVIDAFLADEPAVKSMHAVRPQIDFIRERLTNNQYSFAFRKNDLKEKEFRDDFNKFLAELKASGTYDEIDRTWFGTDESKKVVDMSDLTGENGTLHVVTTSTDEPFESGSL